MHARTNAHASTHKHTLWHKETLRMPIRASAHTHKHTPPFKPPKSGYQLANKRGGAETSEAFDGDSAHKSIPCALKYGAAFSHPKVKFPTNKKKSLENESTILNLLAFSIT